MLRPTRWLFGSLLLLAIFKPAWAADAPPFDTNFVGDRLSVSYNSAEGGRCTGVLRLGDQGYRFAGLQDAGTLSGTFDAGGNAFRFTATVTGDDMTFKTGETTYRLRRAAPIARADGRGPARQDPAPQAAPANRSTVRLVRVQVPDPLNGSVAGTMLVPSDWKTEGGVVWRQNAYSPVTVNHRIFNPNGAEEIRAYPNQMFVDGVRESVYRTAIINGPAMANQAAAQWPDGKFYMGSEIRRRVADPVEVMKLYVIPRFRKDLANAQVISATDMPEVAKVKLQGAAQGSEVRVSKVRFAYQLNGTPVEEDFYVTVGGGPLLPPIFSWGVDVQSFRAARGQLDGTMPLFQAINRSAVTDLRWFASVEEVAKMMQNGIAQGIADAGKISRQISQNNAEISQMIRESYDNRQRSQDRLSDSFSQYIRGTEHYAEPGNPGKRWDLPSGYNKAYMGPRGEIILSNDPNFDPGVTFQEDWKPMPKAGNR